MHSIPIGTYLWNTLLQCGIVMICQLIFCSLAAYALTFFQFRGKDFLFTAILVTMMIPGDVVIITNYIQIQQWGLTDTHLGMALPYLIGGMSIFLMRQFYLTLPLSIPSLSSLAIYEFISIYNRYFWPLLVTNTDAMRTVQIGMAMLDGGESGKTTHVLAGAALCIIPAVIVFIIGQKYLIKGMTAGAVTG